MIKQIILLMKKLELKDSNHLRKNNSNKIINEIIGQKGKNDKNPRSSFERGTNENHNGIIRRFIPKVKSMDNLSNDTVLRVESFINNLPRKILGYKTPAEYLAELLAI